jgi:hypothetical protein
MYFTRDLIKKVNFLLAANPLSHSHSISPPRQTQSLWINNDMSTIKIYWSERKGFINNATECVVAGAVAVALRSLFAVKCANDIPSWDKITETF